MENSPLGRLSGELRNKIYELALAEVVITAKLTDRIGNSGTGGRSDCDYLDDDFDLGFDAFIQFSTDTEPDTELEHVRAVDRSSVAGLEVTTTSSLPLLQTCKQIYREAKEYRAGNLTRYIVRLCLANPNEGQPRKIFVHDRAYAAAHCALRGHHRRHCEGKMVTWMSELRKHQPSHPCAVVIDIGHTEISQEPGTFRAESAAFEGSSQIRAYLEKEDIRCFLATTVTCSEVPEHWGTLDVVLPFDNEPRSTQDDAALVLEHIFDTRCRLLKAAAEAGDFSKTRQFAAYSQLHAFKRFLFFGLTSSNLPGRHELKQVGGASEMLKAWSQVSEAWCQDKHLRSPSRIVETSFISAIGAAATGKSNPSQSSKKDTLLKKSIHLFRRLQR